MKKVEMRGSQITIGDPEVITLLEAVLRDAKSGAISAVAVIAATRPGNARCFAAGGRYNDLVMGALVLQQDLIAELRGVAIE